ncbi:MAG: transcriptional regulator [Gammaproteobacteria bacterium]|nr:transcriptional regulator [Gammaproteobacteria bacterium]
MPDPTDMAIAARILIVDDDPDLRNLIADFLGAHGFIVTAVESAKAMRLAIDEQQPDLVIMDVMMPGEDGLSAARHLSAQGGPAIIMLSALGSDTDRIIGLEVGADDYLPKPCNPRELLARVRAVLRRHSAVRALHPERSDLYEFMGWRLDLTRHDLRDPSGILIELSDGEFSLLRSLVEHPQRVLSRDRLLELAHGRNIEVFDRAIDSQISRLRRKLNNRSDVELIRTVRNEGYMLLPKVTRI